MLTYKPGTPEARLSDLIDLAERMSRKDTWLDPIASAINEVAAPALAARIRAVSAELGKAPLALEPLKVGDRVRVVAHVGGDEGLSRLPIDTVGTIEEHNMAGESPEVRARCWYVDAPGDWGWHTAEELERLP